MVTLKLQSSDGDIVTVDHEMALKFGTIKTMLDGLGEENTNIEEVIPLPNVSSKCLNKVIEWVNHREENPEENSSWNRDFIRINPDFLFELVLAANYLDISDLLDFCCRTIGDLIIGNSAEEIKTNFNLKVNLSADDFKASEDSVVTLQPMNLETVPFCLHCKSREASTLKTCARCKLVKYCCVDCQRKDHNDHKTLCKEINGLYDFVLKRDPKVNLNRMEHGSISQRDYFLLRSQFAQILLKLGRKNKDRVLIESSLDTCLELLCQSDPNNMCNRFRVPFILLDLDRENDAYCFMKWWVIVDKTRIRPELAGGKWDYFIEHDIHEDILDFDKDNPYFDVQFLAAMALIKARIICKSKIAKSQYDKFKMYLDLDNSLLSRASPVMDRIRKHCVPCDGVTLKRQEQHFNKYLDLIQKKNPTFLKALVNPGPLMATQLSNCAVDGSPSEAQVLMKDSYDLFLRCSYAMKAVMKRVGKNPTYTVKSDPIKVM